MARSLFVAVLMAAASLAPAAAEVNAPPLAEFRASDMADLKMDPKATEAEAEQAQERMSQMFHDVRRLMYSYDFSSTCVSSLLACLTDSGQRRRGVEARAAGGRQTVLHTRELVAQCADAVK